MIHITRDARLWIKKEDGVMLLGLTEKGLSMLGQCFVFVPNVKDGEKVTSGHVLASAEGSASLSPIRSPLVGVVLWVDRTLADNPYRLSSARPLFKFSAATLHKDHFIHAV